MYFSQAPSVHLTRPRANSFRNTHNVDRYVQTSTRHDAPMLPCRKDGQITAITRSNFAQQPHSRYKHIHRHPGEISELRDPCSNGNEFQNSKVHGAIFVPKASKTHNQSGNFDGQLQRTRRTFAQTRAHVDTGANTPFVYIRRKQRLSANGGFPC